MRRPSTRSTIMTPSWRNMQCVFACLVARSVDLSGGKTRPVGGGAVGSEGCSFSSVRDETGGRCFLPAGRTDVGCGIIMRARDNSWPTDWKPVRSGGVVRRRSASSYPPVYENGRQRASRAAVVDLQHTWPLGPREPITTGISSRKLRIPNKFLSRGGSQNFTIRDPHAKRKRQ